MKKKSTKRLNPYGVIFAANPTRKRNPLTRSEDSIILSKKDRITLAKYNIFQLNNEVLIKIFPTYTLVASTREETIKGYWIGGPLDGVEVLKIEKSDRNTNRLGRILVKLIWK